MSVITVGQDMDIKQRLLKQIGIKVNVIFVVN